MTAYNLISPEKLVPGEPEDISVVLSNLEAISTVLNGGIDNGNLSPAAALAVSKLQAGVEGYQIKTVGGVPAWVSAGASDLQLTYEGDYVPGIEYQDGDVVVKDNMTYLCVGGPTLVPPDITPWGASGQGPTGATGATGAPGTNGTNGAPGEKWFTGAGVPAGGLAGSIVGDWYINSTNGDYYEKTATSTWTLRGNLKGPTGATGADSTVAGPTGAAGSKWYSGAGAPAGGTGVVGDWYLNTTNSDVYEKTGASAWTLRTNIKGATGNTGPAGADSTVPGPQGSPGQQGARTVELLSPNETASVAATNLAVSVVNAVSDPSYRRLIDMRSLPKLKFMARIGGSLVAATKVRIQYHTSNNPAIATGDAGWTTLGDSAGSHTLNTLFYTAEIAVPAGAQINDCQIRAVLFSGDGAADPTLTACVCNFYA